MPTITLKGVPDELHARLKRAAEENRRSLNSEILVRLEQTLASHRRDPGELLARLREVRRTAGDAPLTNAPLTDAEVTAAKREGRE